MSAAHCACLSTGSTESPMIFTPRLSNSGLIFAMYPSSVVHTGVKSRGCENNTAHESPIQSWKRILPSVVSASKSGAVSPICRAMVWSPFAGRTSHSTFNRSIDSLSSVFFRQLLNDDTACASYLFGCKTKSKFAVVDPHADLVDEYIRLAEAQGIPIVAVFETHVQADHVSGLPELVRRTGATAYLPEGAGVAFDHHALADNEVVRLGNTELR